MTDDASPQSKSAASAPPGSPSLSIRNHLLPGDVGCITYLHSSLYCPQQGWDYTFDCYVAMPLAEMMTMPFLPLSSRDSSADSV